MDNTIRAALDSWLPLIKGLSFDERVGFITAIAMYNKTAQALRDGPFTPNHHVAFEALFTEKCKQVHAEMIILQNEALKKKSPTIDISTAAKLSAPPASRTPEQLRASIIKAVGRAAMDPKAAKDVTRLAKELERIENQ